MEIRAPGTGPWATAVHVHGYHETRETWTEPVRGRNGARCTCTAHTEERSLHGQWDGCVKRANFFMTECAQSTVL